jgi:hypothetical protein
LLCLSIVTAAAQVPQVIIDKQDAADDILPGGSSSRHCDCEIDRASETDCRLIADFNRIKDLSTFEGLERPNMAAHDSWRRLGTARRILAARAHPTQPSDVTFAEVAKHGTYGNFAFWHFDWWMFPWFAGSNGSSTAIEYSVREGDIADLLHSPPAPIVAGSPPLAFTQRYLQSFNHLMDAKRLHAHDGVTGPGIHPARKVKIFASLLSFENVAVALGLADEAAQYRLAREEYVRLYPLKDADRRYWESHVVQPA